MSKKISNTQIISTEPNSFFSWVSHAMNSSHDWHIYAGICLLGVALYARSLFFEFTYFDDNVLILDNLPFLQDLRNVFSAFTMEVFHILHGSAAYYRPLLTISLMPDALIGGSAPFMYHLTNINVHLVASCLVYRLLRTLKYAKEIAVFASLIFVVHPVLTQAVAWIPGRNDSLMTVFVLACFITFIQYAQYKRVLPFALCIIFFSCALFTKETALVIPAIFFLYLIANRSVTKYIVIRLGSGFMVSGIVWAILRHFALKNPIPMTTTDMVKSVVNNAPASIQLLGKAFFPFNLSVLPIIQDTTFVWGGIALAMIAILLIMEFVLYEKSRYKNIMLMLFGLVWFVAFLFPSFIRPNPTIVADFIEHRLYLPIIGLIIFLIESQIGSLLKRFSRDILYVMGMAIILLFSVITLVHGSNFANRLVFWKNAAETSPHSPLAQRNLGAMYFLEQEYDLAEKYFKKSLELNKDEQMAHNNLGLIYMNKGKFAEAEREYVQELKVNPSYDNAHFNLGLLYYKMGRSQEAVKLWKKTLEINPDYADAQQALGILEQR
jgi:hypothetical protein